MVNNFVPFGFHWFLILTESIFCRFTKLEICYDYGAPSLALLFYLLQLGILFFNIFFLLLWFVLACLPTKFNFDEYHIRVHFSKPDFEIKIIVCIQR